MATLEEVIKQRLAEATVQVDEAKKIADLKEPVESEECGTNDKVVLTPKIKKELTKEDLDAMSDEEYSALVEDIEQLDELSKTTLGNYIKAGSKDAQYAARFQSSSKEDEVHGKEVRKKRNSGISKAVDKLTKEDTVSVQVSALLEAEGLSDEFKEQAVTIFEAAVTDRVLAIEQELRKEFDSQLAEAKDELENDIDGFLIEAIQQWKQDNEVAIKSNFKTQLAESFMDGMRALIAEHNIDVPEDKEDALAVALSTVDKLNENAIEVKAEMSELQEQVNQLKGEKILESFKEKMTQIEFDRFSQLTEGVKFKDAEQYKRQLNIVLENFGSSKKVEEVTENVITEEVLDAVTIVTESNSDISAYAAYLSKKR